MIIDDESANHFRSASQVDFIVKEQKPKCRERTEEILAVPPCMQNFGQGTIFPLTPGLYLYGWLAAGRDSPFENGEDEGFFVFIGMRFSKMSGK